MLVIISNYIYLSASGLAAPALEWPARARAACQARSALGGPWMMMSRQYFACLYVFQLSYVLASHCFVYSIPKSSFFLYPHLLFFLFNCTLPLFACSLFRIFPLPGSALLGSPSLGSPLLGSLLPRHRISSRTLKYPGQNHGA